MTPIAFGDVSNPFAEFFSANEAKTALTVKVGGSYQIGYQCCIDSRGGKAYQVCVALMVLAPGASAPAIVTGTQTAAGNYQDEDIAISYFHPFIAVAAGSVLTLALCHNGTLEGGVRSAGLSIKGEF